MSPPRSGGSVSERLAATAAAYAADAARTALLAEALIGLGRAVNET